MIRFNKHKLRVPDQYKFINENIRSIGAWLMGTLKALVTSFVTSVSIVPFFRIYIHNCRVESFFSFNSWTAGPSQLVHQTDGLHQFRDSKTYITCNTETVGNCWKFFGNIQYRQVTEAFCLVFVQVPNCPGQNFRAHNLELFFSDKLKSCIPLFTAEPKYCLSTFCLNLPALWITWQKQFAHNIPGHLSFNFW